MQTNGRMDGRTDGRADRQAGFDSRQVQGDRSASCTFYDLHSSWFLLPETRTPFACGCAGKRPRHECKIVPRYLVSLVLFAKQLLALRATSSAARSNKVKRIRSIAKRNALASLVAIAGFTLPNARLAVHSRRAGAPCLLAEDPPLGVSVPTPGPVRALLPAVAGAGGLVFALRQVAEDEGRWASPG